MGSKQICDCVDATVASMAAMNSAGVVGTVVGANEPAMVLIDGQRIKLSLC
jgi:hypothetical protein